ncbi:hypothetical protein RJ639_037610 [Escallonia herrerae]|uniref:U-box domain-containing protein n=1 Tax=Escallonia herrerae TaxID=1293975 RepID=A0AA88WJK1_9ASTE|nr:hypothetical protein RJ639_037610 [Escallonia herrerae]
MDEVEAPEYFICPISLHIMKDPVTIITGITYDRESIEHWLHNGKNTTCPVTKQALPEHSVLTPNHMLQKLIQAWCSTSSYHSAPAPKSPLDTVHVHSHIRELSIPNLQLKSLRKLEILAVESEMNRQSMVKFGVDKVMLAFIVSCYEKNNTAGLEEALSILNIIRLPSAETRLLCFETECIINALTWVLGCDLANNVTIKSHAVLVLKAIIGKASSNILEMLKPELFVTIVGVLRLGISHQGINGVLHIMLAARPWGQNRIKIVEAGAVMELVELELGSPEKRTTELVLGVLFHLCSCAEGRAQFLSHAAGIAVVTKRILKVSQATDDRAILILALICKFSGTSGVLQEMLRVGSVAKLLMVLQADCPSYLKDRAREILRGHSDVWRSSCCVNGYYLTRYPN